MSALLVSGFVFAVDALAQSRNAIESPVDRSIYALLFVAAAGMAGAFYFWRTSKKGVEEPQYNYSGRYKDNYGNETAESGAVDAEKELEWLRRAKKKASKPESVSSVLNRSNGSKASARIQPDLDPPNLDTRLFQEKMKKLQYAQLPINSFSELSPALKYEPLPVSNDEALLSAVEQANEEFEEDEAVRSLAVRILAAFRTRNSVEALSQIALYDLSSSVRSKAVAVLTDFDHESVFEAIVLACADPTREVRAAAARGLFRLNFDRSGAWRRIIETNDDFRMIHAVRAAVESGIVHKSFDRLVHEDMKVAREAFTLVALMIKAGEDQEIFETIREHKDERVKFALLHVIKAIKDERSLAGLNELIRSSACNADVQQKILEAAETLEHVTA